LRGHPSSRATTIDSTSLGPRFEPGALGHVHAPAPSTRSTTSTALRCIELTGADEKQVVFAAVEEGPGSLVEGAIPPDPAGRFFERKTDGVALVRAK
jgi:hypothetical protein